MSDLTDYDGMYIGQGARSITGEGYRSCATQLVPAGTVLFSSRAPIGYVAIAERPLCTSQGFRSFIPFDGIDSEYLYWWLRYAKPLAVERASGTTFLELSGKAAATIPIPVPPVDVQRNVARTLSSFESKIRAGKAAFEAAMTGLDAFVATGTAATFDLDAPTVLLESVAHIQSGITKGRPRSEAVIETPYLRTANVQAGYLDLTEIKTIPATAEQRARHLLQAGDVCILEGGDADKVGRGWVWDGEIDGCLHQNHVFAVRTDREKVLPEFLAFYVNSPAARRYFASCAKQTVNLASINKRQLRALPVPVPSLAQQGAVVEALRAQAAAVQAQRDVVCAQIAAANRLLLSVLHAGFSGALIDVPGRPVDLDAAAQGLLGMRQEQRARAEAKTPAQLPIAV